MTSQQQGSCFQHPDHVSNTILQLKEPDALEEMTDSEAEAGDIQDEPETSYSDRK